MRPGAGMYILLNYKRFSMKKYVFIFLMFMTCNRIYAQSGEGKDIVISKLEKKADNIIWVYNPDGKLFKLKKIQINKRKDPVFLLSDENGNFSLDGNFLLKSYIIQDNKLKPVKHA